jgi:hypothetical protein
MAGIAVCVIRVDQICRPSPPAFNVTSGMRAREEAARRVVRPIILGQMLGIAALVGLLAVLLSGITLPALSQLSLAVIEVVAGTWLLLTPIALYFELSRE